MTKFPDKDRLTSQGLALSANFQATGFLAFLVDGVNAEQARFAS
jgi:hypothetical protein